MGDFVVKLDELAGRVGNGDLEGSVEYDQPYAQNQHESIGFRHAQGGQAKWLELTLQEQFSNYFERVADGILEDGGVEAMIRSMEDLALSSSERTPIGPAPNGRGRIEALHPGLLRASAHPIVTSGGTSVYDKPGAERQQDRDTTPGDRGRRGAGR